MKLTEMVAANRTEAAVVAPTPLERTYKEAAGELAMMTVKLANLIVKTNKIKEAVRATASLKTALKAMQNASTMLGG